jgi:hypothetical protein
MSFPHLGGVLKLGFTFSFVPISILSYVGNKEVSHGSFIWLSYLGFIA